jgi:hypothetical protein
MTPQQKAKRLALIKKVAKKIERERKLSKSIPKIDSSIDRYNINQYTDASQYANQYYGDVCRETTREWD